nr:hypothetical protein [Tanacetum cinerariifolium]
MVRNGEHKCSSRSDIQDDKTISEDQSANKVDVEPSGMQEQTKHQQLPAVHEEDTQAPVNKSTPRINEPKSHTAVAERPVDTNYSKAVQMVPGPQDYYNVNAAYKEGSDGFGNHIFTAEYLSMMKRLGDLEEKVIILTNRPIEMPPEKEEILNNALKRIESLEIELSHTKRSLEDSRVQQQEFAAYLEKKKKKKNIFGF